MNNGRIAPFLAEKWLNDLKNVYFSLHTSDPDVDNPRLNEVSGGGYKRTPGVMVPVSPRAVANDTTVRFANLPPVLITHLGIWNTEANGSLMASVPLRSPARVSNNASYAISVRDIVVSIL